MTGTESTNTEGTDLFAGLDSLLTSISKETGTLEIDTDTNTIETNEASKALATKKAEEAKAATPTIDESGMIDVDVSTPTTAKTADTSSNKEIKNNTTTTTSDTTNANNDVQDTNEESEALKSFVTLLKEKDVLSNIDLETYDGSIEGLKESITNEAKGMADEYKESLPPIIKYLIDNYEDNVPLDQLINIKSNEIRYSNIDTEKLAENPDLQKELYKEFLRKTTNFSDAKINKETTRLEELGALSEEVNEALPELIKNEKQREKQIVAETKAAQEAAKKQNEEVVANIKKTASELKGKEIVPGIKLTDKDVLALNKSLTTPVGYDNNGTPISEVQKMRSEDPIGFELRLNYLAKITKGFTDFSEIMKKANTVAAKAVEKAASSTSVYKGGKSNIIEEDTPKDLMSAFKKYQKTIKSK